MMFVLDNLKNNYYIFKVRKSKVFENLSILRYNTRLIREVFGKS